MCNPYKNVEDSQASRSASFRESRLSTHPREPRLRANRASGLQSRTTENSTASEGECETMPQIHDTFGTLTLNRSQWELRFNKCN